MGRRQELEVGLKLQEREIERKQEGLVALREQLDAVNGSNADLYGKLQVHFIKQNEKFHFIHCITPECVTSERGTSRHTFCV